MIGSKKKNTFLLYSGLVTKNYGAHWILFRGGGIGNKPLRNRKNTLSLMRKTVENEVLIHLPLKVLKRAPTH